MFLGYIHTLRALAIIAVVGAHVVEFLDWPDGPAPVRGLLYAVLQNGTVPFLFVAGFLFQHLSPKFRYRAYLWSKLTNVIVPYAIMSMPALVEAWRRRSSAGATFAESPLETIAISLRSLLTAEHLPVPFWFIPMIALFYVASPLLVALDRRPKAYWMILPLIVLAMFVHRPAQPEHLGHALLYFTSAYLGGMCLSHFRERALAVVDRWLVVLFALSCALVVVDVFVIGRGGAVFAQEPFSTENGIIDLDYLVKLMWCLVAVSFLRRYGQSMLGPFDYLAGASFGVFFVHRYVIDLLTWGARGLGRAGLPAGSAAACVLIPVVTLASLGLVWLTRWILGKRSRFVVGC